MAPLAWVHLVPLNPSIFRENFKFGEMYYSVMKVGLAILGVVEGKEVNPCCLEAMTLETALAI